MDKSPVVSQQSRSRLLSSYLKSPSPKKQFKDSHCFFCPELTRSGNSLALHLSQSNTCKKNYFQNFKVNSLDAIIVSQFLCYFCPESSSNNRISHHLKHSPQCLQKYKDKFSVQSMKDLLPVLEKLRRKMRPSRSRASRRLETSKKNDKKDEKERTKTKVDLINQFRRETVYSNTRLCHNCGGNFTESRAEVVSPDQEKELEKDPVNRKKRRFEKYFVCLNCKDGKKKLSVTKNLNISVCGNDENILVIPESINQPSNDTGEQVKITSSTTLMLPCSVDALSLLDTGKLKCRSEDVGIIYQKESISPTLLAILYENEAFKFKRAKYFGDRFNGKLREDSDKTLVSADKVVTDFTIVGSDAWRNIEEANMKHRMEQNGTVCFSVSISLKLSPEVLATCLIQKNIVVSATFDGKSTSELETKYLIHNHQADVDCGASCVKQKLEDYLNVDDKQDIKLKTKHLSTYVSSSQNKLNSFVRNFVKSSASDLHSEDFHFELTFSYKGMIKIEGFCWPSQLNNLNIQVTKPQIEPEVRTESIRYIDSAICTTSDAQLLKAKYLLSDAEANEVSQLVNGLQFHFCQDENCKYCIQPKLPSLETMLIECPKNPGNLMAAKLLNNFIISKLRELKEVEVTSLKSGEWIENVFEQYSGNCVTDDNAVKLILADETFKFEIDDRMKSQLKKYKNAKLAIYHYSISSGEEPVCFDVVLQRLTVKDCFLKAFNLPLLKAFGSEVQVLPCNGFEALSKRSVCIQEDGLADKVCDDDILKSSHREVSLSEALHLFDKNLSRTSSSTTVEFLNSTSDRKQFFKKVSNPKNGESFQVDGKPGHFLKLNSTIDRYFARKNGFHLTLTEFALYYDLMRTNDESEKMIKLFENNIEIKDTETPSAFDPKKFLPEFIHTGQEVMKYRTSKKILSFPNPNDFIRLVYQKVLMFFPLREEEKLKDEASLLELYNRKDEVAKDDSSGLTVIQRIER